MTQDQQAEAAVEEGRLAREQGAPPVRQLDGLNRWLALGANLGLILGLIILIFEVRQNATLTRIAMEAEKNMFLAEIELSIGSPAMSSVWVKSIRAPQTLTDSELRMLDAHLVAVMLQWDHMFQMESAGLVSRRDARQHIERSAPYYFGSRFGKGWWNLQETGWENTPMMEVAGPVVDNLDENFLQDDLDAMGAIPSSQQNASH